MLVGRPPAARRAGPKYAWANSYREDERLKVGKRSRIELSEAYRRRYLSEILDQVDLGAVLESLPDDAVSALLCVERDPRACHRSLIAARLQAQFGVPVLNL